VSNYCESRILTLGDGTVLVECGPMRMFVEGYSDGIIQPELCRQAAQEAIKFLEQVAEHRAEIQAPGLCLTEPSKKLLTHEMWQAVRLVGDEDLTPMAAVAGTIADATADWLASEGLSKVVVNNGGDVALRLSPGETITVGIRPEVTGTEVAQRVLISSEMNIGGVCTSGLGGRSFTRGVASAATAFASRASVADAAATAVANATFIVSPAVHRCPADSIDPNTDLRGVEITCLVEELTRDEIDTALKKGLSRAEQLVERGVIVGAYVAVKGEMRCTAAFNR
jgi:ApbE superfamily uncharacterized protein (UPF0280 family)